MTQAFTATFEAGVPLIGLLEQWRRLTRLEELGRLSSEEYILLDEVRQALGQVTVPLGAVFNTEMATAVDDRKAAEQDVVRRRLEERREVRPRLPVW